METIGQYGRGKLFINTAKAVFIGRFHKIVLVRNM